MVRTPTLVTAKPPSSTHSELLLLLLMRRRRRQSHFTQPATTPPVHPHLQSDLRKGPHNRPLPPLSPHDLRPTELPLTVPNHRGRQIRTATMARPPHAAPFINRFLGKALGASMWFWVCRFLPTLWRTRQLRAPWLTRDNSDLLEGKEGRYLFPHPLPLPLLLPPRRPLHPPRLPSHTQAAAAAAAAGADPTPPSQDPFSSAGSTLGTTRRPC